MENPAKIVTGVVRLSYVALFEPKTAKNSTEPKYSTAVLIPKSDKETLAKIKKAIEAVKADPKNITKWGGLVPKALKLPLHDGDTESDDLACAGHYYFNCSSKQKPPVVDKARKDITDPNEVYSGCYARVSVTVYAYNVESKGIAIYLNGVQKWKDGEPLGGGRINAEKEFDDGFGDDEEAEDFMSGL